MPRVRGMHGERLDDAIGRVESVVVRVLRRIAQTMAALVGGSPSPRLVSEDDLQVIRRDWATAVTAELVPALTEVFAESAQVLAGGFTDAGRAVEPVSVAAPETADFLDAATNRLVGVADTLWEIARKELADGIRVGEGVEELAARLQEAGGFGSARAHTIARTEVAAAANSASLAQALRLGDASMVKEWIDADDERVREAHQFADGQVVPVGEPFEVGGEFLMYPGQPIGNAENVINCFPGDVLVHSCGKVQKVYRRWYEGVLVRVNTTSGVDLAGTPNHPVLTNAGWKPLQQINMGDKLVKASSVHRVGGGEPEVGNAPTEFAEMYRSATQARMPDRVVGRAMDFHGDGTDGEVEVIPLDSSLSSPSREQECNLILDWVGDAQAPFPSGGEFQSSFGVDVLSQGDQSEVLATRLMGGCGPLSPLAGGGVVEADPRGVPTTADLGAALHEALPDHVATHAEAVGKSLFGGASDVQANDLAGVDRLPSSGIGGRPTGVDPRFSQAFPDRHGRSVNAHADLAERESLALQFDEVLNVELLPFSGHVYNLETDRGAYIANSIVASNCRCTLIYDVADTQADHSSGPEGPLTAAAEVHNGAMIALRPSAEDAERLAVDGGEPADQLHVTLMYLGDAADIPPEAQEQIIAAVRQVAEGKPPLTVDGFAVSAFNPGDTNDRDPCIVLGLSGDGLDDAHGHVVEALLNLQSEPAGFTLPEQHAPWQPHVTLVYTDDLSMMEKLADLVGPVTFDAIRVAFAGEITDIPLVPVAEPASEAEGDFAVAESGEAVDAVLAEVTTAAPVEVSAQPGEHFHTRVLEGVSTGMREFAPGAITWRDPPFAYHWQWKSAAHGGLPETVQVGLVTRAERADPVVHFWGRLDLRSPEGLDYARRLVEGWTRWSSVGADESVKDRDIDVEYVLAVEPDAPVEDPEIDLMTFRQYRVAEITAVSVPALADATVEPTPELIATLTEMGVIQPTAELVADDDMDEPSEFTTAGEGMPEHTNTPGDATVVVAAGHTITLPDAPPAAWFDEPADDELPPYGSVRVDANGRLIGLLAPAEVNHRSFPGKRVKVPMGNVDYSGWQNKPHLTADGQTINVGVITMNCGHASTSPGDWSYVNRREHYDNTCSIAAHARAYEKPGLGVALAGAVAPWLDADGFGKLLSSDLSGDWPPHPDRPGWRDFVAALAVPVGGFPNRARLRVAEGALVAAAVPVHFDDQMEEPMDEELMEGVEPVVFAEGDRVRVLDPRDPDVTEGEIVAVHAGPAYALSVPGRDEPYRWLVAEEIELAEAEPTEVVEEVPPVEVVMASAEPDLGPALDFVARKVARDPKSRMAALRDRVHQPG